MQFHVYSSGDQPSGQSSRLRPLRLPINYEIRPRFIYGADLIPRLASAGGGVGGEGFELSASQLLCLNTTAVR